jgi:alkylation response protein AidB-like acyl-CoA dehydrogenase
LIVSATDPQPGPRSLSLLLVDKRELAPGSYVLLPAEKLHGIRGADISGLRLVDATVPAGALGGREGEGTDITLKALQLTRVLLAALSLGAADHALAITLEHARGQVRFGRRISQLPQTRHVLAQACADLLLVESASIVGARAVHALTPELSPVSAAMKFLLPTVVQRLIDDMADVIGTRSLMADATFAQGRFQKLARDHRLIGIFDGSSVVNLQWLIVHFPFLLRGWRRGWRDEAGLAAAMDLSRPLPASTRGDSRWSRSGAAAYSAGFRR